MGFPDTDAEKMAVLDQIIIGCKSEPLRRKLLETDNLGVDSAVKAARAYEASITHTQILRDSQAVTSIAVAEARQSQRTLELIDSQACAAISSGHMAARSARNTATQQSAVIPEQQNQVASTTRSELSPLFLCLTFLTCDNVSTVIPF